MPKLKTNSSAAKRFKITANGKYKKDKAYGNHILTKKNRKRKRRLRKQTVASHSDQNRLQHLLPYL